MVNGKTAKEMVEGNRFGKMELFMKVAGKMIWQMVSED